MNDLSIQGIPVNAKDCGGLGLVPTGLCERALNEFLFEFVQSFFQKDATVYHFGYKRFQFLFHNIVPWILSVSQFPKSYWSRQTRSIAR